jgi:hypothetical protein
MNYIRVYFMVTQILYVFMVIYLPIGFLGLMKLSS